MAYPYHSSFTRCRRGRFVSSAADKRLLSSFLNAREPVMKNSYSIEEERMIAERSELIVRGLTLGTVSDDEAKKALRVVRLCATRANSSSSTTNVSSAR